MIDREKGRLFDLRNAPHGALLYSLQKKYYISWLRISGLAISRFRYFVYHDIVKGSRKKTGFRTDTSKRPLLAASRFPECTSVEPGLPRHVSFMS